jgi:hypothetical protein
LTINAARVSGAPAACVEAAVVLADVETAGALAPVELVFDDPPQPVAASAMAASVSAENCERGI